MRLTKAQVDLLAVLAVHGPRSLSVTRRRVAQALVDEKLAEYVDQNGLLIGAVNPLPTDRIRITIAGVCEIGQILKSKKGQGSLTGSHASVLTPRVSSGRSRLQRT